MADRSACSALAGCCPTKAWTCSPTRWNGLAPTRTSACELLDLVRKVPIDRLRQVGLVENRWVPEGEVGSLLAWADGVVLPYREASQSGVAAAAVEAGRFVVATRVGGLPDQLRDAPGLVLCAPESTDLARAIGEVLLAPMPETREVGRDWHRKAADLASWISVALH